MPEPRSRAPRRGRNPAGSSRSPSRPPLAFRLAGWADGADRADIICRYHIWHSFGIRLPASTLGRVAIQRGEPLGLCEVIHRVGIEKWIERLDLGGNRPP